jgi:NAD(P)-dependent dehydrogenase (short-subunit alcohol dehydrogenase family)
VADFSSGDAAMYERIEKDLAGLDIGVLVRARDDRVPLGADTNRDALQVNNVGMSYSHAQFLNELDPKEIDDLIEINVRALTKMTRLVVPGMVCSAAASPCLARPHTHLRKVERRRGAIVNVGSGAGLIPAGHPLYSVYAGTKAYVDFFSRSLHVELRGKGVHVQCCVPFFVTSKLSKIRKASLGTPTPDRFARAAVAAIGAREAAAAALAHPIWRRLRVLHGAVLGARRPELRHLEPAYRRRRVLPDAGAQRHPQARPQEEGEELVRGKSQARRALPSSPAPRSFPARPRGARKKATRSVSAWCRSSTPYWKTLWGSRGRPPRARGWP